MIEYEKDEDGFISDINLPEEQMLNFKVPKFIHDKIESFSYLTIAHQFKAHIEKINNQFLLTSIKEIEEVKEFLENPQSETHGVFIHFLSHSYEIILLNHENKSYSCKEYDFEYIDDDSVVNFIYSIKEAKEYENWIKNHPIKTIIDSSHKQLIFFDKNGFENVLTPIIYGEDFEQYQALNLNEKLSTITQTPKGTKLKV